ncbi:septal ring lytic transglycosylase RlpA family protein [Candidatus Sumerlaeota bacterium]|nr:septal ring lytic transglycosylase RlpA family protein [Candidatus Sumerlaeota bacterium]
MRLLTIPCIAVLSVALASCAGSGVPPRPVKSSLVATDSSSYNERGRASYYGPGFDGKKTASGEVFRKNAMTAAHPSLAFDTKVRVTNLKNGKWTVVRINDRFGGHKGRIIDLSEGAFKQLADLKEGVIDVEVKQVSE